MFLEYYERWWKLKLSQSRIKWHPIEVLTYFNGHKSENAFISFKTLNLCKTNYISLLLIRVKYSLFDGFQNYAKCLNIEGVLQNVLLIAHQARHHFKGFRKVWRMVKTKILYLNPKEYGTCLIFWRILLCKIVRTPL